MHRATFFQFTKSVNLRTCTAEDLVVFKAFANRTQDWADIESILEYGNLLDWDYVFEQLNPLAELKEEPDIMNKLNGLKERLQNL